MEQTRLPKSLDNHQADVRDGLTQWSRIVAWSWTDYIGHAHDQGAEEEKKLKTCLISMIQKQAVENYAVMNYGDDSSLMEANRASLNIKKLLIGKNLELDLRDMDIERPDKDMTLSRVYHKLMGQEPTSLCQPEFMNLFHVTVITDRFFGHIRDITEEEKQKLLEHCDNTNDKQYIEPLKYVNQIAYPPRPVLSEATVTKEVLENWATGKDNRSYLPPSAYIPVCCT